jgi:hypothetical protein
MVIDEIACAQLQIGMFGRKREIHISLPLKLCPSCQPDKTS